MLQDKKIALLIEDMFNVFEFWYPYYRLKEEGAEVMVVGSGRTAVFSGKPGTWSHEPMGLYDAYGRME